MLINRLLIVFYLLSCCTYGQHTEVKGIVSIKNSKFLNGKTAYVSNASVFDDDQKAQRTITGKNGDFTLIFVHVKESESVSFFVTKENLQVINLDALTAVAGQKEIVKIIMADPKMVADFRREIYHVGKTQNEKYLTSKINRLSKELSAATAAAAVDIEQITDLKSKIKDLELQLSNIDIRANELADYYSSINLDDAGSVYQEAFRHFQAGDLDAVEKILKLSELQHRVNKSNEMEKESEKRRMGVNKLDSIRGAYDADLIKTVKLALDLHKTRYDLEKMADCYKMLYDLDKKNTKYIIEYADILEKLNDDDRAIAAYKKAADLTVSDSLVAVIKTNLGEIYQKRNEFNEAETFFNESLEIQKKLYAANPEENKNGLISAHVRLGSLYLEKKQYGKAIEYVDMALVQRAEGAISMNGNNPDLYKTMSLLSLFRNEISEGKESLKSSVEMLRTQAGVDPGDAIPQLVKSLCMLSRYSNDDNNMEEALRYLKEAREYYSRLKPEYYQDILGYLLFNESEFEIYHQDEEKGIRLLNQCLTIYKNLVAKSPAVYQLPYLDRKVLLADYYTAKGKNEEAFTVLDEIEKVYHRLYTKDSVAYGGQYAVLKTKLAAIESMKLQPEKALKLYDEAVSITQSLYKDNPQFYSESLASIYYVRGRQLYYMGQTEKAKQDFEYSLALYDGIKQKNAALLFRKIIVRMQYGIVLQNAGEIDAALSQLTSAKREQEILLSPDSTQYMAEVASNCYNLAIIYSYRLDYIRAERELQTALNAQGKAAKIDRRPFLVTILLELSKVQGQLGRNALSEDSLSKALELQRELAASDSNYLPFLANILLTKSISLSNRAEYNASGILLDEALGILDKLQGNNDVSALQISVLSSRANLFKRDMQYSEAEKYLALALENFRLSPTANDAQKYTYAYLFGEMAALMVETKNFSIAEENFDKGLSALTGIESYPRSQNLTVHLSICKAYSYALQNRPDKSIPLLEATVKQQELMADKNPEVESPNLADCLFTVGNSYRLMSMYKEAEKAYDKAEEIQLKLTARYKGYNYFLISIYRAMLENFGSQKDYTAMDKVLEKIKSAVAELPKIDSNQALLAQVYLDYNRIKRDNGENQQVLKTSLALNIAKRLAKTDPDNYTLLLITANAEYAIDWEKSYMLENADRYYSKADTLAKAYSSTHKMDINQRIWIAGNRIRIKSLRGLYSEIISLAIDLLPMVRKMAAEHPMSYENYLIGTLGSLSEAYIALGQTAQARDVLSECIILQESLSVKNDFFRPYMVTLYALMGRLEYLERHSEAALASMDKAIKIQEELKSGNKDYAGYLVTLYEDAGLYAESVKLYDISDTMRQKASLLAKENGINGIWLSVDDHIFAIEVSRGKALRNAGRPKDALDAFTACKSHLNENKSNTAVLYFEIGMTYKIFNDQTSAQSYFKEAKKIYKSLPNNSKSEGFEELIENEIQK